VVVRFEFDHCGRRMSAATVVVRQRGASATLATRNSLNARATVQENHTASSILPSLCVPGDLIIKGQIRHNKDKGAI
jgi:hypothetical protein